MFTHLEAYLLGKMRAADRVAAALRAAGCSPEERAEKARRATEEWGLDRAGYSAGVYREAIGDPVSERILNVHDTAPAFVGSVCRLYYLSLWPKVLFQVNQHPSGYAWGEGFVRGASACPLPEPSAIEPWEWVTNAIESVASQVEVLDHWDHQKDLRLVLECDGNQWSYIAKFDFDLLQEWRLLTT